MRKLCFLSIFEEKQSIKPLKSLFSPKLWKKIMSEIQEIDTVLLHVQRVAQRLKLPLNDIITQQILLLGDAFYGYRYTATGFTAVWSAADQLLKVFDVHGRVLETFSITENAEVIPLDSQRRAA
jgi:hypothetical protein